MADVRSDIYSVGVVMYEALSGRLPFTADNPADLIVAVLNNTPLPLHTFRPELGRGLADLVQKSIARSPDERFQTADEMRIAIAAARASAPEVDALSLPRRFLAPSEYPAPLSAPPGNTNNTSIIPVDSSGDDSELSPPGFPSLALRPFTRRGRWLATAAVAALGVGLIFALVGGESNAGARGRDSAPAAAPIASAPVVDPVPPLPSEVIVELTGLPDDAVVHSDGTLVGPSTLRFVRDTGLHEIVVHAPGKVSWNVKHDSSRDGRYAIALASEKKAQKRGLTPKQNAGKKPGLLRRPDF
jgi:hypothetical protein